MKVWCVCVCLCVHEYACTLQAAAGNIINMLWQLMENGLEELKLLQTVLVLLTTNTVVHDEVLSKVHQRLYHTDCSYAQRRADICLSVSFLIDTLH